MSKYIKRQTPNSRRSSMLTLLTILSGVPVRIIIDDTWWLWF